MATVFAPTKFETATTPRPVRWTVEQYHQIYETGVFDERRVELLDGEIIEMPPIGNEHRSQGMGVVRPLLAAFGEEFQISIQSSLILDDNSEPEPDVVIARGHWREFADGLPVENVVLVAEISKSTLHTDLNEKAALYAKAGISEYWVIDLINSELVVHRAPSGDSETPSYSEIKHLKKGDKVTPLHAPDSIIQVGDLLL